MTANYGRISSIEELEQHVDRVLASGLTFGFDIETGYLGVDRDKASLHPETAIVVGISFTNSTDWARYAPLGHDFGENLDNREAARLFWRLLSTGRGVAHNAAFELRHLSKWFREQLGSDPVLGAEISACGGYFKIKSDSMVDAYLAADYERFGLKYLTEKMFGHKQTELGELFPDLPKNKHKGLRFNTLDMYDQKNIDYACEDAVWCLAIHRVYHPQVKDTLLWHVEHAIVQDCIPEMEDFGVRYDWGFMRRGAEKVRAFRDKFNAEIMAELTEMVGQPVAINLGSPAQLSKLLFDQLGFRTTVYTPKTRNLPPDQRKMSTGAIALERLGKQQPVVKKITQWKELTKLLNTYLDKYEGLFNYADDGRTHPNHMSAVVVTGRFAVSDPPYQQSPKQYHYDLEAARVSHAEHAEAHGKHCTCEMFAPPPGTCFKFNFRDAIVAPPEHYILGFDLSQAELRAIAGEAQETELLRAFEEGRDVHTLTASLMLGIPVEQITKDQRAIGKTMNFALLYGMGVKSLADRLAVSVDEAQYLYDSYFRVYANIATWSKRQVELGRRQGYVTSRFGRKLPIWNFADGKPRWIQQQGERQCVNFPIQGGATGDYMKMAMVRARNTIHKAGLADRVHLVMNVHDALEFYVHQSVLPQDVITLLQPAVIFPVNGWPAMQADWHLAKRWGSPKEVELTDDGKLIVKGDRDIELTDVPTYIEDEDGELVPVLPEVDPEVLKSVLSQAGDAVEELELETGTQVIVEVEAMPDADAFNRFQDLIEARAGHNNLILRTPEGDLDFDRGTSLSPDDLAAVSVILGPVKIYHPADLVDADAFLAGLTL